MVQNNSNNNDNNDQQQLTSSSSPLTLVEIKRSSNNKNNNNNQEVARKLREERDLRIAKAASLFEINETAKVDMVGLALNDFYELLVVKLRTRLSEDRARIGILTQQSSSSNTNSSSTSIGNSNPTLNSTTNTTNTSSWIPSLFSSGGGFFPQLPGNPLTSLFALSAFSMAQNSFAQSINPRLVITFFAFDFLRKLTRATIIHIQSRRLNNFVSHFSAQSVHSDVDSEKLVREVAQAIALRLLPQIVPLSRNGKATLSRVIVDRISTHFKRGRFGLEEESRVPIVAMAQNIKWTFESLIMEWTIPADRVPRKKPLALTARVIRALTTEILPGDEVSLEFEPFFASSTLPIASTHWTADGVLSKTGLRVQMLDGKEALFAHSQSDYLTYGFVWGTIQEAEERGMKQIIDYQPSKNNNSKL
jgi:hypothetical protein